MILRNLDYLSNSSVQLELLFIFLILFRASYVIFSHSYSIWSTWLL